ncbi:MAG TPA: hypothetical protein VIJ12_03380 [Candidatus Baltobacteraceae bacterium]
MKMLFAGAMVVGILALAACGATGNNGPAPSQTSCPIPTGAQMIYPIPGATAVPDAPQQIVIAVPSALSTSLNAIVDNSTSQTDANVNGFYASLFQTIQPSQVPQPAATPSFANPIYESSAVGVTFKSATTLYVFLNDEASNCLPTQFSSFTTQ